MSQTRRRRQVFPIPKHFSHRGEMGRQILPFPAFAFLEFKSFEQITNQASIIFRPATQQHQEAQMRDAMWLCPLAVRQARVNLVDVYDYRRASSHLERLAAAADRASRLFRD
jgi:hypothetical protein